MTEIDQLFADSSDWLDALVRQSERRVARNRRRALSYRREAEAADGVLSDALAAEVADPSPENSQAAAEALEAAGKAWARVPR